LHKGNLIGKHEIPTLPILMADIFFDIIPIVVNYHGHGNCQ